MKNKLNFELVSKILLLAINAILLSFIAVPLYEEGNIISIFGSGNILLKFSMCQKWEEIPEKEKTRSYF